jgi:hypothetical protein
MKALGRWFTAYGSFIYWTVLLLNLRRSRRKFDQQRLVERK